MVYLWHKENQGMDKKKIWNRLQIGVTKIECEDDRKEVVVPVVDETEKMEAQKLRIKWRNCTNVISSKTSSIMVSSWTLVSTKPGMLILVTDTYDYLNIIESLYVVEEKENKLW